MNLFFFTSYNEFLFDFDRFFYRNLSMLVNKYLINKAMFFDDFYMIDFYPKYFVVNDLYQ